jgi:GntR family transcriptional regulator/MocR family aminotransferase
MSIKTHCKRAIRCVYICANRDYPTVSLTAERRLKLLQLAKEYQFAIIDDYDYDFQFEGLAMLPGSSDANGMVIYLGKLGQSLFPSFQTGFVVAPENFRSQELFAMRPPRRFNTRTNAI